MRKLIVKMYLIVLLAASVLVASAANAQEHSNKLSLNPAPAIPHLNPYEVISYSERLEVFKDGNHIGVVRSEKSNIERWGFIDSGNHIVVISRTGEGSATIELFDTVTCTRVDKLVMSCDQKRPPAWAAGFLE